jgi:hypothetical protein
MNKTNILLCITLLWIACSNCVVHNQSFNARFYTSSHSETTWHLYIDDADKGVLPFIAAEPDCDNPTFKRQALLIQLPSGEYDIDVKDQQGNLGYSGTIKVKRSRSSMSLSSSTRWKDAGVMMTSNNDCLVNKIFFP